MMIYDTVYDSRMHHLHEELYKKDAYSIACVSNQFLI